MNKEFNDKDMTAIISDVVGAVVGQFDMASLLNQIINTTMRSLKAEVCSIFLEDKEREPGVLRCVAGSGFAKKIVGLASYKIGEGFTGMVAKTGIGYNSKTRQENQNIASDGKKVWDSKFDHLQWPSGASEFRNGIALPIKIKDQILGVIKAENKIESDYFTDEDLILFQIITNVIALTIENARLLQMTEKQLKTISAKAAHRINNQATNYDGIELDLEDELTKTKCNKENLKMIYERLHFTTINLKKMIGEFKHYGMPLELNRRMCSINKIIQDEVWLATPPKGIKIETSLNEKVPDILLDEGRIGESIKELISNSLKAISKTHITEGLIKITSNVIKDNKNKKILVKVEDNGPDFPPNFPVFEPFNSTDPQGTGLGLATVKELIEAHGGEIKADKSPLGGACINLTIPF